MANAFHNQVNLRFRCQQTVSLNKVASSKGWKQIYALPSLAEWAIFGTGKLLCTVRHDVLTLSHSLTFDRHT